MVNIVCFQSFAHFKSTFGVYFIQVQVQFQDTDGMWNINVLIQWLQCFLTNRLEITKQDGPGTSSTKQKVKKKRCLNLALKGLMMSDTGLSEGVPGLEHSAPACNSHD